MKEKKKFLIPEAELIDFANHDIITLSAADQGAYWGDDDNCEDWDIDQEGNAI